MKKEYAYRWLLPICLIAIFFPQFVNAQIPSLRQTTNSSIRLRLNQRFYSNGDMLSARLLMKTALPVPNAFVVIVSPRTGDAEGLKLMTVSTTEYATPDKLKIEYGTGKKENDGVLYVQPGETIVAYYYNTDLTKKEPVKQPVNIKSNNNNKAEADMVAEFAMIRGQENYQQQFIVGKNYALFPNEAADNASTILVQGEMPVQIANSQLIYYSKDGKELKEFLEYSKGQLISSQGNANLVQVSVKDQNINDLGQLRQFLGYKQKVVSSNPDALKLIQFCELANLDGYAVSLNPRMQSNTTDAVAVEKYFANPPGTGEVIPGSFTQNTTNIVKAWNYMAIWDKDNTRINVGIIDMGFSTNNDFRNGSTMTQCVASVLGVSCSPNAAQGVPTVGASLFGERVWHGNGVEARIGGVLNNNFGTAGTGGQVVVPILIKMSGVETYAFNIGGAIRTAVNNGAHVINISAGFPCRALTSLGDFTFCDPGTRTAICAALFPIVETGAIIACSALGFIPFAGPFLVAGCIAIATTVYITACIAQIAIGNPGDVISQAVQFAKSRGVPVVASAGNFISPTSLPAELRPFIDLREGRMTVEEWQIVPAGLPDVICVGAAAPSSPFANTQVFGARVDVWGPEDGKFFAPARADVMPAPGDMGVLSPIEFSGTSATAPFITGLVADAMALNPQLNRSTSTSLSSIPGSIRSMLSSTAWQNGVVPLPADARRRNLVNPIAFLKAVVAMPGSPIPTFPASIYGDAWNTDRNENANDVTPTLLLVGARGMTTNGSITMIPGTEGASNIVDKDLFRVQGVGGTGSGALQIRLRTPTGSRFGNLTIRGVEGTTIRFIRTETISTTEEEKIFEGPSMITGVIGTFSVEGQTEADDNIYFLRVGEATTPAAETVTAISLSDIGELCPTTLVSGDREFGGGPLINVTARLERTADESGIDIIINYRAEETGGDHTTATGEFRQRVFNVAAGTRIVSLAAATSSSSVVNFRGAGAGAEFGICNEGVVQDAPVTGGLIRRIVVVGDTGGNDVSAGGGCRCDTKIRSISFNPVTISTAAR